MTKKFEFVESKMSEIYREWECCDKTAKAREIIESLYDDLQKEKEKNLIVLKHTKTH